jgi:hypothetical protein
MGIANSIGSAIRNQNITDSGIPRRVTLKGSWYKGYVARRLAEGHSKLDAIRALKRYLAREVFTLITQRRKEINATRIAA